MYCLSWGAHPDGWTALSCDGSQSLSVLCIFFNDFYI
jgi:hypothetical protein